LTRCSLDRVTPGSQHIVGDIAYLGQGLPSGLLNSFARFPNRPFGLGRRGCGRRGGVPDPLPNYLSRLGHTRAAVKWAHYPLVSM
jgi:hypothetical protein